MAEVDETLKENSTFKKYTYRSVDLDQLFSRGLIREPMALFKKLRKPKKKERKEAPLNEKPEVAEAHLRNMIVVPETTGSFIGVYNGKDFDQVEIKPKMNGHYLSEFVLTYKAVKHGRPELVLRTVPHLFH